MLSINEYKQYKIISSIYMDSLSNWEKTRNYIVIPKLQYSTSVTNFSQCSKEEQQKNKKLYFYFNSQGAVLANFSTFELEVYKLNSEHHNKPHELIAHGVINTNYLKMNKILDENGKKINISEKERFYILLVPAKYHNDKNKILNFYQSEVKTIYDKKRNVNIPIQKIKIIWIKSGQKLFTYNLNVNVNNGNCVNDPIVNVLTESNGSLVSYMVVAGIQSNPLKIKVADSLNPNKSIIKEFKKYYKLF